MQLLYCQMTDCHVLCSFISCVKYALCQLTNVHTQCDKHTHHSMSHNPTASAQLHHLLLLMLAMLATTMIFLVQSGNCCRYSLTTLGLERLTETDPNPFSILVLKS